MTINNSPNISVFDFDVLLDISLLQPVVTITNRSTGSDLAGCSFQFSVISPSGYAIKTGTFELPDAQGAWVKLQVTNLPLIQGQIEWGGAGYQVVGVVKDSEDNEFTATKSRAVCKPYGCVKNGHYGLMSLNVETKCENAKLQVQEKSNYFYDGGNGLAVSAALKLLYPNDDAVTAPLSFVFDDFFGIINIPIYRDGEGYQLLAEHIRDYANSENYTVRIKYKFKDVFAVACTYDLCCLIKSVKKYADELQGGCTVQQRDTLLLITTKLAIIQVAKMQPQCGIIISDIVAEIKTLLGDYYDCGCCNYGIHDLNGELPATPSSILVDAGADQTIELPDNDALVEGTASVTGGTIVSESWTQLSGPDNATIGTPTAYTTNITGLVPGVYTFKFQVQDNTGRIKYDTLKITVVGDLTVNAGTDQGITLPTAQINLSGSAASQGGAITSHVWSVVSGPNTPVINNRGAYNTTLSGLASGTYVIRLTAQDTFGRTVSDEMTLTVAMPTVSVVALNDFGITLPSSSCQLTCIASGSGLVYAWTRVSGPNTPTINQANTAAANVTGMIGNAGSTGTYIFKIRVTDQYNQVAEDTVTVTVAYPSVAANAGTDIDVQLPTSTATLLGSGTGAGTPLTYAWAKISGPTGGAISNAALAHPNITGLTAGTYVYRLTVTDVYGHTATDDVSVAVSSAPPNPVVNAGIDDTTSNTSYQLGGSATISSGTITGHVWTQVSGPNSGLFNNDTAYNAIVSNLIAGTYVFKLTATSSLGTTAFDTMTLVVSSETFTAYWGYSLNPFSTSAQPTLTQRGAPTDTGIGGTRTQYFAVGASIIPGCEYYVEVYSHKVAVSAVVGDTATTIATKLKNAVNATTAAQWRIEDSAGVPVDGTAGFKPTATSSGVNLDLTLDYQHSFITGVTAYNNPTAFAFQHSGTFNLGAEIGTTGQPVGEYYRVFKYPASQPLKNHAVNTVTNYFDIPDAVFADTVTSGGSFYAFSKVTFPLQSGTSTLTLQTV